MDKKTYEAPQVVYEGNLEVQAGSEIGDDFTGDLFGDLE
jgi:hypothetical protein